MNTKELSLAPGLISELLDVIHNALIVVNAEYRVIYANSRTARMFRAAHNEMRGEHISSLFMSDDVEILVPNILSMTKSKGEFECESMFQRGDGTTFLGKISGTWFRWDEERDGMAFSIHDISDMKAIEQSLKRSERIAFLGRLVDDISHQIRNPVMVIGGFARRLKADRSDSRQAEAIIQEAARLEELLDTLNHFSSLPRPKATKVNFSTLIPELEEMVAERVRANGCRCDFRYDKELLHESLLIDSDLFWEALLDVVDNACQSYTGTGSSDRSVLCEVSRNDDKRYPYVVRIVDRGIGISAHVLGRVFAHFYTDKTGYIGMGLTFAQRIIEEQGGQVMIESTEGVGTTVSLQLVKERRRRIRTTRLGSE